MEYIISINLLVLALNCFVLALAGVINGITLWRHRVRIEELEKKVAALDDR